MVRDSSVISHLFIAYDSLLFAKANKEVAQVWKCILHQYKLALGQVISFQNSSLYVSPNVSRAVVDRIKDILGVEMVQGHVKCRGLYLAIPCNKTNIFSLICERIGTIVAGLER